jgi:hypothetical protein
MEDRTDSGIGVVEDDGEGYYEIEEVRVHVIRKYVVLSGGLVGGEVLS